MTNGLCGDWDGLCVCRCVYRLSCPGWRRACQQEEEATLHYCPSTCVSTGPATHTKTHTRRILAMCILEKMFLCWIHPFQYCVLYLCCLYILFKPLFRSFYGPRGCSLSFVCFHSRYICSSSDALTHLWSELIVTTHSFKRFQLCCRLTQQPFKIVSLCFGCGYLAAQTQSHR